MSDLITLPRATVQQALAHVQEFKRRWMAVPPFGNKVNKATREAVTLAHVPVLQLEEALRAALEQPEQEPFGYIWPTGRHPEFRYTKQMRDGVAGMPLYTHPPRREWRSLSEEEIKNAVGASAEFWATSALWIKSVASAAEAALKEKNHG
jgi:hypothetical protein